MTYDDIVRDAKKAIEAIDYSKVNDHLAVEVDVEGEGEGAFYIEFENGTAKVEPFNYFDRDVLVRGNADAILDVLNGRHTLVDVKDKVMWEGNISKAAVLKELLASARDAHEKTLSKTSKRTGKKSTKKK
ncbi:MAG: SCP2 sterol-binding domain-containing protein [Butyrivibrio sp.]|nr:SCP2 sterol-binding domain-containing protein [Butyrivibrio sp.]